MKKYYIKYKSLCGKHTFQLLPLAEPKDVVDRVIAGARIKAPNIEHWIEEIKEDSE